MFSVVVRLTPPDWLGEPAKQLIVELGRLGMSGTRCLITVVIVGLVLRASYPGDRQKASDARVAQPQAAP
jgi:hypothetical protein